MINAQVRALLRKEVRQIRRNRAALLSATLVPILVMVIMPLGQLAGLQASGSTSLRDPGMALPPGMAGFDDASQIITQFLLPLAVTLGGLIVPPMAATYTIVTERERRSIELLVALPASVRDILTAKLLAMLMLAALVLVPLFLVDAAVLLGMGMTTPGHLALLLLLLLTSLSCSVSIALLLALLARDLRTANNVNGAITGPIVLAILAILALVPGDARFVALIALLLLIGAGAMLAALRWLTFERYLT